MSVARGIRNALIPALLFWMLLFVGIHKACADDTLFHHVMQANVIAAPVADMWSSVNATQFVGLREANPLYRRTDGSTSPGRMVLVKSSSITLNLYLLHKAHTSESRTFRTLVYSVVGLTNGLEWWAAVHNSHLPHVTRR